MYKLHLYINDRGDSCKILQILTCPLLLVGVMLSLLTQIR